MAQVNSVVIFGDPFSKTPVPGAESKTLVICHNGDNICDNGALILPPHLTYGLDTPQAAAFIAQMAGLSPAAQAALPATIPAVSPAVPPASSPATLPVTPPVVLPAVLPAASPAIPQAARI